MIAFEGAYHGDTFGAMALGERSLFTDPYEPLLFAVARVSWPHSHWDDDAVEAREHHALRQLEQALETPTAAVILEQHGYPPTVMSLESVDGLDHVIFVYKTSF